jgi:NAD(P)-dependent dehydrogenase (short-subunit alcohol dehydrogenase family)
LAINLTGYLLCSQILGQQMIARGRGGAIVHISSLSGHMPQPYSGAYSVSKAGVRMLSQLLAVELGQHRIRSNVVSPGMIRTPMSEMIYADQDVLRLREEIVPAHRVSQPEDIADVVLYLVSERSSYINGQDIVVDGGLSQALLGLIPRPGFER